MKPCALCGTPLTDKQIHKGGEFCTKSCSIRARSTLNRGIHCAADGCDRQVKGLGYCDKHYQRIKRNGTLVPRDAWWDQTEAERFWSKVDKSGDCWLWTSSSDQHGYGQFMVWRGGTPQRWKAHRYALGLLEPGDSSHVVMHICDNPPCVNPAHLRIGTQRENMGDMWEKGRARNQNSGKTECIRGHLFDEQNTMIVKGGRGRQCRECNRLRLRARRRGLRLEAPGRAA